MLDLVWKPDDLTYQRCLLVAGHGVASALRSGLSRRSQRLLAQAAEVLLNKPGPLTTAEMEVMKVCR